MEKQNDSSKEARLRLRVENCRIFLQNTRSFPARQAALDAYAQSVQALDDFLALPRQPKESNQTIEERFDDSHIDSYSITPAKTGKTTGPDDIENVKYFG